MKNKRILEELEKTTKAVVELRKAFGDRSVEVTVVDTGICVRVFAKTYAEARDFMRSLECSEGFETFVADARDNRAYISECRAYLDDETTLRISFDDHPPAVTSWVHGPKGRIVPNP